MNAKAPISKTPVNVGALTGAICGERFHLSPESPELHGLLQQIGVIRGWLPRW